MNEFDIALATQDTDASEPSGILVFCTRLGLSLRSRIEVLEQVCSAVSDAHRSGVGLRRLSVESVSVSYVTGSLSIWLGNMIPLPPGDVGHDMGNGRRYNRAEMIRALNIFELGHLLERVTRESRHQVPALQRILDRAASVDPELRFDDASSLADALRRIRYGLEQNSATHPDLARAERNPGFDQRWSWSASTRAPTG